MNPLLPDFPAEARFNLDRVRRIAFPFPSVWEPYIVGGTVNDYWRGDKTWQPFGIWPVALGGTGVAALPMFSVHKNGTNQVITAGVWTELTWSTERWDTNANFASNRFTPSVAGKYSCYVIAQHIGATVGEDVYVSLRKNGAMDASASFSYAKAAIAASNQLQTKRDFSLNGTDYVSAWVYRSVNTDIEGDQSYTSFEGGFQS